MQKTECNQLESTLAEIWSEHRDYLRRLLISLTRDIDVAEDLLQETYLKARNGLANYRGGDARAWLSVIARNGFYSHVRSRPIRSELPLGDREDEPVGDWPGSAGYLAIHELRHAIDALAPGQRTALIMKHYGGFTYKEIGEHLHCPTGTVQRRVWTAMQRLRDVLVGSQKEPVRMKCEELRGLRMLDYLYGTLSGDEAAAIEAHLDECGDCRQDVEQLRGIMTALDSLDEDFKSTAIVELDEHGTTTGYLSLSMGNPYDKPDSTIEFGAGPFTDLMHVFVQGEEASFELLPKTSDSGMQRYRAHLAHPLEPGGRFLLQFVFREPCEPGAYLGDGRWRMRGHWQLTEKNVTIVAARLPCGARLECAEPKPDEVRSNGTTTLIWRRMMQPNEEFESIIEYAL